MSARSRTASEPLTTLLSHYGFDSIFANYPEPAFAFDQDGKFLACNDLLVERTGFTREEFAKIPFTGLTPPEDLDRAKEAFASVMRGEAYRIPITQTTKAGEHFRSGIVLLPFTHDGEVLAVVGFARNIDDLDATDEKLRADALLLQMAGRLARFGAWSIQVPSDELYWSDELCEIYGYPPGEIPPSDIAFALNSTEVQEQMEEALRLCKVEGIPFDLERNTHDARGEVLRIRTIGEAFRDSKGTITRIQGASWDVTEQYRLTEARREIEERLSITMGSISDGIALLDKDWKFLYVNPRAEEILRTPAADLLGNDMWEVFPEGRGTEFSIAYRRALAEKTTVVVRDYYEPLAVWLEVTAYPTDAGLAIYFRDVSEEERSNQLLRTEEKKVASQAALLDLARDPILVLRLDHTIDYWNKAAETVYGWTSEEAVGGRVRDLFYDDPTAFDAATQATIRDDFWSGEIEQKTKSGKRVLAECTWTLVRDVDGNPESILAVNRDITERRKIEEGYLRTQRIESLGTLAGGVAHDLNNVLTPILMTVQMLERGETDASKREMLRTMESSVKRGADMIRQVLTFARGVEGRRVEVNVARTVHEAISITRDAIPAGITVSQSVDLDLWPTIGDPTQMLQVLINLINNAKDAMPDGGIISVRARNVVLKDTYSSVSHLATPGNYVLVEVQDNGTGMPAEVLTKIFEPFFTTKEQGKGTGLGLATSIAIIRSHGGYMQAYSEIGNGSRFQVHLPAFTGESTQADSEIDDRTFERLPRGNGQLVLVIDDEAAIRQITRQTLEAFGYKTALASNGAEALEYLETIDGKVDLVFTDMMMPVMDGPTTVRELVRTRPEIPIIAASGLNAEGGIARVSEAGVTHFLSKPFTTSELLHAVRDALDDGAGNR